MSLGKTHAMWKESVPVTCFPFRYHDREHGTIVQTWADVKDKLGRDAQSQAIPFNPGHIAPSQLHSNIIAAMCKKEEKNLRRLEQLKQLRASSSTAAGRPSSAPAGGRRAASASGTVAVPQTTSEAMAHLIAARQAPVADQPAPTPPAAVAIGRPQRPMSAVERRVLTEGDGDGSHGRVAYLRLRRRLPVQHRTNIRRTSSQAYGWEQLDLSDAANAPARQEQALIQAVGHGLLASASGRPGPSGVAAAAATVASAAVAASRKRVPVPEFTKSTLAPASASASAADAAANCDSAAAPEKATAHAPPPMRMTAIGTMVAAHPSGQREAGQSSYYGRRSYMNQLSRRTGVFSRD